MSTRIGNARIVLADGVEFARHRFERWSDGRATIANDNAVVLRQWEATTLEPVTGRSWRLTDAEGAWLATITKRGG